MSANRRFSKPRHVVVLDAPHVAYPPLTPDFQFEVELLLAVGRAGCNITFGRALDYVWGDAVGVDLTRRDRQRDSRNKQPPWEVGKSFDGSAPCGNILPSTQVPQSWDSAAITLKVNRNERQRGDIGQMIWNVPEVVAQLSRQVALGADDLIYTGTLAGVGPVSPGVRLVAHIDGLPPLTVSITPMEA
jgi:fumarylpyruvate hydrolase